MSEYIKTVTASGAVIIELNNPVELPEPPPTTLLTQLAFLRRFTAPERIAIRASTDPIIVDFLHLLGLAQDIDLTDPDTVLGTHYLEQQGLLAAGRATEILS